MNQQSIGTNIKRLRDQRAWTQEELAAAAAISVRTVQRAEEGTLSADTLKAVANALGVSAEKLSASEVSVPPLSPVVYYDSPDSLQWLCDAFGFEIAMKIPGPDGRILHAELFLGDARIIVGPPVPSRRWTTPQAAGCRTQSLYVYTEDPDAHCRQAETAGASILVAPETVHGQRRYLAEDCEGHHWWFFAPLSSG